jgi:outer membrane protein
VLVLGSPARAAVSLSLADALRLASERRAEMTEAKLEIERAKLRHLAARLAYFDFHVTGHGNAGYEGGNAELYAPNAPCAYTGGCPANVYDADVEATLNVPVWSGLSNESKLGAARSRREAAEARARVVSTSILVDVARAYWAVRRGELLRDAVSTELGQYRELEKLTQHEVTVGTVAGFDLNRIRSEALSVEARLRATERELGVARAQFGAALEIDEEVKLTDDLPMDPPPVPARDEVERTALAVHPELMAVRAEYHAAELDVRAAKGGYWPQLSLVGQAAAGAGSLPRSYNSTTTNINTNNADQTWAGYFAGAQLTWQVFDMLGTWLQVREAQLAQMSARAERTKQRYRVIADVRAAHAQLSLAAAEVGALRQAVTLARSNVDVARRRYAAGTARLFEVLDVQRELVRLEQDLIDSAVNVAEADMQLRAAVGRL